MRGLGRFLAIASAAALVALYATASTQQCNTACQTRLPDCFLSADGRLACELDCKARAAQCVDRCSLDAGPPATEPRPRSLDAGEDPDARATVDARAPIDATRTNDGR